MADDLAGIANRIEANCIAHKKSAPRVAAGRETES